MQQSDSVETSRRPYIRRNRRLITGYFVLLCPKIAFFNTCCMHELRELVALSTPVVPHIVHRGTALSLLWYRNDS
jgi:hypothetical protein